MSNRFPKISILTPSCNQAQFLEEAIVSVVTQNYPNVEYVIVDGGSSDCSVDIIRKYEAHLAYWVSEPEKGQCHALNKGFAKTTGEIMAWLNSDDKYTPWAFSVVAEIFSRYPEIEWLTTLYPLHWDDKGRAVRCSYGGGFNRHSFFRGANLPGRTWYARSWIQQESTFWRRSLWERTGGYLDTSLHLAGDFDLWARFFGCADLYAVATPLAGFRKHAGQKTATRLEEYLTEAERVLLRYGGQPYGRLGGIMRRSLHYCLGGRPLKRLPPAVGTILTRLRILYPVKVCVWTGCDWGIATDYVV